MIETHRRDAESAEKTGNGPVARSDADFVDDPVTYEVIGAAIAVHRALGPGLLESAYQACLAHELKKRRVAFEREVPLPVNYDGERLDCGYRLDFLVAGEVIVEIKCVEAVANIHLAQLLTYLRLSGRARGLLINFNEVVLKDGIYRRVLTRIPGSSSALSASLR